MLRSSTVSGSALPIPANALAQKTSMRATFCSVPTFIMRM